MKKPIVLLVLSFCFVNCDNAFTPEYTLAWEPPVVNQLIDTSERGGYEITLGIPVWKYKGGISYIDFDEVKDFYINFESEYFYDNPTANVSFALAEKSSVRISLMPARLPDEDPEQIMKKYSGSILQKIRAGGVVVYEEENLSEGMYSAQFRPIELGLPSGFYQIMLETAGVTKTGTWYYVNSCEELHPELVGFFIVGDCYKDL